MAPDTESLYEIIYQSLANSDLELQELKSLIAAASINNKKHGITGCLVYHDRTFIQVIEGGKSEVKQLAYNISNDRRHSQMSIIWEGQISSRGFGRWTMASVSIDHEGMKRRFTDLLVHRDEIESKNASTTAKALLLNMRELLD